MTYDEIWEQLNSGTYKKPNPIIENVPDVALNCKGKPLQWLKDERPANPHIGFRGKKIDKKKFMDGLALFMNEGVRIYKASRVSGLSNPTFTKRVNQILTDGYLPWYLFEDGKPLYLEFEDERMNEMLRQYRQNQQGGQ